MNKWQDMYNTSQHGHFHREIEPLVSQRIKYRAYTLKQVQENNNN